MIAFIKRRWLLLSWVVVILVCSFFDFEVVQDGGSGTMFQTRGGGLWRGSLNYYQSSWPATPEYDLFVLRYFHSPFIGGLPTLIVRANVFQLTFPLWLAISIVVGWIVFRELRWREKRAKQSSSAQPDTKISAPSP